jgi:hypothetical protein
MDRSNGQPSGAVLESFGNEVPHFARCVAQLAGGMGFHFGAGDLHDTAHGGRFK